MFLILKPFIKVLKIGVLGRVINFLITSSLEIVYNFVQKLSMFP